MERAVPLLAAVSRYERMGLLALAVVSLMATVGTVLACRRAVRRGTPLRHLPGLTITDHGGGSTTVIAGLAGSATAVTVGPEAPSVRPVALPAGLTPEQVSIAPERRAVAPERTAAVARAVSRASTETVEDVIDRAVPGPRPLGQAERRPPSDPAPARRPGPGTTIVVEYRSSSPENPW